RLITQNAIWPGSKCFSPSRREISLQYGGKIEETFTRFKYAIPASRKANSNEASFSLCFPTPLVRKIFFGTKFNSFSFVKDPRLNAWQRGKIYKPSTDATGNWTALPGVSACLRRPSPCV